MIDTFSRHRPLSLLAIVVLVQVLLLAFQIKRENNVRLVRYWAVELMTPLERAGTWTFSHVGGVWGGYVGLRTRALKMSVCAANWTNFALGLASLKAALQKPSVFPRC